MSVTAEQVKAYVASAGFLACGITPPAPNSHAVELDEWLRRGYAGTMRYLHRQAARRKDPRQIVPEARSIIVVLDNYYSEGSRGGAAPKVAKYALGADYHGELGRRLESVADWLRSNGAAVARVYVDAGPVPERELAQRAGLGWIGKNTMLIRPGHGSFFFIGSIFTDLPLRADDPFSTDHCGSCSRCLDACPTEALVSPQVLDATRCISYLTIEYRGPFSDAQAGMLNGWGFGCDICNDVCPWNERFAEPATHPGYAPGKALEGLEPDSWEAMTEAEFARRFGDSPLERAGLDGMRRNWRAAFTSRAARPGARTT
jgi:epoxyqueuosine reductase